MTPIDRFICRREGHVPSGVIHKTSGVILTTYSTTCQRCGKWVEVDVYPTPAEDGDNNREGTEASER